MSQHKPTLDTPVPSTKATNAPQSSSTQRGTTAQSSGGAANAAKQKGEHLKGQVSAQAAEATAAVKEKAAEATQQAKESARKYAAEKKGMVADEIGVFSGAIRKASGKLREEQHDSIACYVDAAAEQLDRVRGSLQNKSTSELLGDLQGLTRRQPELVYGGLFLAGLTAMRFLKASRPQRERSNRSGRPVNRYREDRHREDVHQRRTSPGSETESVSVSRPRTAPAGSASVQTRHASAPGSASSQPGANVCSPMSSSPPMSSSTKPSNSASTQSKAASDPQSSSKPAGGSQ